METARSRCSPGSYYGAMWLPLNVTSMLQSDPLIPDGTAQQITAWSYIGICFFLVIVCCVARYSQWLQRALVSAGANLLMLTLLLLVAFGYGGIPNVSVFWVSNLVVGTFAGTIFLLYENYFFFTEVPLVSFSSGQTAPCLQDKGETETETRLSDAVSLHSVSSIRKRSEDSQVLIDGFFEPDSNILPLGARYPNIQFVIGFFTFAIVTLEVSFVVALAKEMACTTCAVEMVSPVVLIVQKLVQSVVYACLGCKIANPERLPQSIFSLYILGVLNFAFWMDSLSYAQYSLALQAANKYYGEPFKILEVLYEALVADYRLLCCALFVEHAQDIRSEFKSTSPVDSDVHSAAKEDDMTVSVMIYSLREQHRRYLGYGAGFFFVGLEMLQNLKHVHRLHLPREFGILGLLVHVTLAVCVILFVRANPLIDVRKEGGSIVKFLVAGMGAAGLFYFLFKTFLDFHFAWKFVGYIRQDAIWDTVSCGERCLSLLFLIYLFLNVDEDAVAENFYKNKTQFLLPMLTVTIFGVFLGTLVEFHESKLARTIQCHTKSAFLAVLFTAAPPLYLGFLMHTFAKVYMTSKHARKRNLRVRKHSTRSSLEEALISPSKERLQQPS